ncbi:hypothetical protein GQ43DRAFT_471686 [Delitschia confertaspora ATCC 74209]|uniref:Extracellular serine-rich protein n=1 Tax=Delitschia confertaspora ATCC 74209 TaxID=1513339 RepID=A0A9P4JQR9_9PLEO|nr:hypothetical protein GQ43DRAFT_471686 [Delitschia confertaspora ATCC 74209]
MNTCPDLEPSSKQALPPTTTTTLSIITSSTTTSSGAAHTHTISVGQGDHKFRPDVTQAEIGDVSTAFFIIEFNFFPQNHSVVRAEYKFPCIPYEMTSKGKQGFFAGFHPVDAILSDPPKYLIRINDSDPIFFYCSAPDSCIKYGMVGVINPNASTFLATQHQMALDAAYMLQPGDPFPDEADTPTNSTSSPGTASTDHGHGRLKKGAIAGILVASVTCVILAALLLFFIGRTRILKGEVEHKDSATKHRGMSFSPMFEHGSALYNRPGGVSAGLGTRSGDSTNWGSIGAAHTAAQGRGDWGHPPVSAGGQSMRELPTVPASPRSTPGYHYPFSVAATPVIGGPESLARDRTILRSASLRSHSPSGGFPNFSSQPPPPPLPNNRTWSSAAATMPRSENQRSSGGLFQIDPNGHYKRNDEDIERERRTAMNPDHKYMQERMGMHPAGVPVPYGQYQGVSRSPPPQHPGRIHSPAPPYVESKSLEQSQDERYDVYQREPVELSGREQVHEMDGREISQRESSL